MKNILVIEDDHLTSEAMGEVLEMFGYSSVLMEKAEKMVGNFDAALVDLSTGTLENVIKFVGTKKVIIVSGAHDVEEVAEKHNVRFLTKPFNLEDLIKMLEAV